MDLFMPAERVLYDRAYYLSDEAERDYAFEVAEEHGIDVGEVLYSDELMKEVRDALDRDIDLYLDDEIANFDSMLRELKRGENPEQLLLVRDRRARFQPRAGALPRRDRGRLGCRAERESI